jgi:hypothetical protein
MEKAMKVAARILMDEERKAEEAKRPRPLPLMKDQGTAIATRQLVEVRRAELLAMARPSALRVATPPVPSPESRAPVLGRRTESMRVGPWPVPAAPPPPREELAKPTLSPEEMDFCRENNMDVSHLSLFQQKLAIRRARIQKAQQPG